MIAVDDIFAGDRRNPRPERSLPWEESRDGVTVILEPKPHWASDMLAWRQTSRAYCYYADWTTIGPSARFFRHPGTCGGDIMMKARAIRAREIADGLWR